MTKTIGFIVLWMAGSAAAVGVAWAGVTVVSDEIINPAPATYLSSETAVSASLPDEPSSSGQGASLSPSTSTSGLGSPTSTVDSSGPGLPTVTSATGSPAPRASTPTTSGVAPVSPNPTSSTPSKSVAAPETQTQTFNLVGGSVAITFSATTIDALWATANPDFELTIEPEPPGLKVEFRADHHRSRVDAWWSGGPQHSVREEPDS